jgi:hypothetical protein
MDRRIAVVALVAFATSCSGAASNVLSGDAGADGSPDATAQEAGSQVCTPGRSLACVGPGGCAGGQSCNASGTAYGPCDCAGVAEAGPDASDGGVDADASTADADAASDASQADEADACTTYTHSNGMGQSWTDCVPLGTYNEVQAAAACEAYVAVMGGQCGADCIAGYSAREPDDGGDGCNGTCITVAIWMYAPTTSTTLGQGCYIGPNTLAGWSGNCTGLVGGFGSREGSCPALSMSIPWD